MQQQRQISHYQPPKNEYRSQWVGIYVHFCVLGAVTWTNIMSSAFEKMSVEMSEYKSMSILYHIKAE